MIRHTMGFERGSMRFVCAPVGRVLLRCELKATGHSAAWDDWLTQDADALWLSS